MSNLQIVKGGGRGSGIWAPLQIISLTGGLVERALERSPNLPGILVLHGPSGYGKSMAAAHAANRHRGVYVEIRSAWRGRDLMLAILKELGVRPAKRVSEMLEQIAEELTLSRRPLIVDEVDYIAEGKLLELLRDIHDASRCAMLLIGEEMLPRKLQHAERFHNRVLAWQPAPPASLKDAEILARFYAPSVEIAPELIAAIVEASRGCTRRICVNIDAVRDFARQGGLKSIDANTWGTREFYTGRAAAGRA